MVYISVADYIYMLDYFHSAWHGELQKLKEVAAKNGNKKNLHGFKVTQGHWIWQKLRRDFVIPISS